MVDLTMNALITAVQKEVYQVAGLGTQIYSKDIIMQRLQGAFDMIVDDKDWKRFDGIEQRTLDGVTGQVTAVAFTTILAYDNIRAVYPADGNIPLVALTAEHNVALDATGGRPRFVSYNQANPGKLVKVWPIASTGDIIVIGKTLPIVPFVGTDTVPFDSWCLIYFAAWSIVVDDANNPAQADRLQNMFETRKKQVYEKQTRIPIAINEMTSNIPSRWTE